MIPSYSADIQPIKEISQFFNNRKAQFWSRVSTHIIIIIII